MSQRPRIVQAGAPLDLRGSAGAPFSLALDVTVEPDSVVLSGWAVEAPVAPTVTYLAGKVVVEWSAEQTAAMGSGARPWALTCLVDGAGPHPVVAGSVWMAPITRPGEATLVEADLAVSIGQSADLSISATLGGGTTLHAELTDTDTNGHPASVITYGSETVADVLDSLGDAALLDVGTTAGTVAAGDDPRIAGAVPASTLTTNGDLLTRASGVPARITRAELAADPAFSSQYVSGSAGGSEPVAPAEGQVWLDTDPEWRIRKDRLILTPHMFDLEGSSGVARTLSNKWPVIRFAHDVSATNDIVVTLNPVEAGVAHWNTAIVSAVTAPTTTDGGGARLRANINTYDAGDVADTPSLTPFGAPAITVTVPTTIGELTVSTDAIRPVDVDGDALIWHVIMDRNPAHASDTYDASLDLYAIILERAS